MIFKNEVIFYRWVNKGVQVNVKKSSIVLMVLQKFCFKRTCIILKKLYMVVGNISKNDKIPSKVNHLAADISISRGRLPEIPCTSM